MSSYSVVTGASAGIGRATVQALARAGERVIAVARREDPLRSLAEEFSPGCVTAVVADVTAPDAPDRIAASLGDAAVSTLVHGAGIFPRGPLTEMSRSVWEGAWQTNVSARLWLTAALRDALAGGRVLFVGSDAATTPRHGGGAYSVSKAGSAMLWKCLREELGDEIAFGIAKPGLVATAMLDGSLAADRSTFGAGAVYAAMNERGETISAETIGAFFRWLLLEVEREAFAADVWDVRDESHHARWLRGPLYRGPAPSSQR